MALGLACWLLGLLHVKRFPDHMPAVMQNGTEIWAGKLPLQISWNIDPFTFTFRSFSRRLYPKQFTITFVRRKINNFNLDIYIPVPIHTQPHAGYGRKVAGQVMFLNTVL